MPYPKLAMYQEEHLPNNSRDKERIVSGLSGKRVVVKNRAAHSDEVGFYLEGVLSYNPKEVHHYRLFYGAGGTAQSFIFPISRLEVLLVKAELPHTNPPNKQLLKE